MPARRAEFRPALVLLVCLVFCGPLAAEQRSSSRVEPLWLANQNPFSRIYALPAAESGLLLAEGQDQLSFSLDWASHTTVSSGNGEQVWIDGEGALFTARWRGTHRGLEWGLDLPAIYQGGGQLDGLIDEWHSLFGLPEGDRDQVGRGEFLYGYQNSRSGETVQLDDSDVGLADIKLQVGQQLWQRPAQNLALRAILKLPTGDSDAMQGSGAMDAALSLAYLDSRWMDDKGLSVYSQVAWLWTGEGDILADQRRQNVAVGSLGLAYQLAAHWQFKTQVDAHSAFYKSAREELGSAVQLALGISNTSLRGYTIDFGFTEDIKVNSAADFGVFLRLARLLDD